MTTRTPSIASALTLRQQFRNAQLAALSERGMAIKAAVTAAAQPDYESLRGHGLRLTLDQQPDRATLIVEGGGQRIEVRGHPAVGAVYEGARLDRVINAIPKKVNLSALFAGEVRNVGADLAVPIIDALEYEDEIQRLAFASVMA